MYKKIILVLIITIISFNSTFINANASTNLSHSEMSDIYGSGYSNALLETVVEVNAKASTRLEENRNLLTQYYDDTKGYINQRIQDYGNVKNFGELLIEQASGAMTLADTVLDLLSSFFGEQGGEGSPMPVSCKMSTNDNGKDYWSAGLPTSSYHICKVQIVWKEGSSYMERGHTLVATYTSSRMTFTLNMNGITKVQYSTTYMPKSAPSSIGALDAILRQVYGGRAWVEYDGQPFQEEKIEPKFYKNIFNNYRDNPTTRQPVYIPQLQPKLSCPDGDKIVQIDGRGGFVHANGVPVNADGCTVYWQKPSVTVDDDGKVKLTDPVTGETTDIDVKPPKDKIPVEDKGQGCDSVLCFLGGVTAGIADLISTILGLVADILDGLFELVKKIFLPSESFWSSNMDGLKNKFFHKEIKEVQNGIQSLETVGGGQFGDVTGSLMGVDNLKIIDSSSINMSLDTLHSWVRGFFYPLLLFFNINQMYRVIRGTSLVGIGGKKEE